MAKLWQLGTVMVLAGGCAIAQTVPPVSSLPNAPSYDRVSIPESGANGAPEYSNATPQLKQTIEDQSDDQESPAFILHHLIADRLWISGQSNFIFQAHTPFHSPYAGPNSFRGVGESATSHALTLYTGLRLRRYTELIANLDAEGGHGLSNGVGIAAFLNADAIGPGTSRSVFVSRLFIHETVALTADRIEEEPNPFYLQPSIPRQRLEFTFGKLSLLDFFDVNGVGSDPHLQFTNVAVGNNGIYEDAADEHGFTVAAMVNYQGPKIGFRFAEALAPNISSGIGLNYNLRRAHSDNYEFDYATYNWQGLASHVRALVFVNHAALGIYSEANRAFLSGAEATPDVTAHRQAGTAKTGFGVNLEQELPRNFRVYFRGGWNDGRYESFSLTEMNNTISFGGDLTGDAWHRKDDRLGSAWVYSGISEDHRQYLGLGGIGFQLGDGALIYGRESVGETYYTAHIKGGLYLTTQLSFVNNPGFNRARGPVVVPGLRAHLDF